MNHDWVPSRLGHGETMCRRCFITNREAAALGRTNHCDTPPPVPKAANENAAQEDGEITDQYRALYKRLAGFDPPSGFVAPWWRRAWRWLRR